MQSSSTFPFAVCPHQATMYPNPGAKLCLRALFFLLVLCALPLSAQIATRDALIEGVHHAHTLSAAEMDEHLSGRTYSDPNSEIFLCFARLQNSLAAKNTASTASDLQRILTATDRLADENTLGLVYSELAETLSRAENYSALILERDQALQKAGRTPNFPSFQVFASLGKAFRDIHDSTDADAAYDIAGHYLANQPDQSVATFYATYASVLIQVGRLDTALDYFQRARAIYLRLGHVPTQLLVDNAELELTLKHYDAAQDCIDHAIRTTSPADSLHTRYSVHETSARIFIARQRFEQALECIHRAQAIAPASDFRLQHFTFALYHELYLASRNYPALIANAQAMLASAKASGSDRAITYSKGLLGLALGLSGDVEKGIRLIDEAAQENTQRRASTLENLRQKSEVFEAVKRYPEALNAYRAFRDAKQEWDERTNQRNLSHLESTLALEKSEETRRNLLAAEQVERSRQESNRLHDLDLLHQERLRAADAEQLRKDTQIKALRTQGQLIAAEKMRQQLVEAQSNQQLQLEYITRRSQLQTQLSMLLLVCLLLTVALAWSLWRVNINRRQQALEDPLTGLKNRRFLSLFMEHEAERLRRSGLTALVLIADVDFFKNVNDRWGHDAGDTALVQMAEALRFSVRHSDVVARWGGEEFVIICPQSSERHAAAICNRIRHNLEHTVFYAQGKAEFHLTISLGAALFSPATLDENWESALARADEALLHVKRNGRDNWSLAPSQTSTCSETTAAPASISSSVGAP